MIFRDLLFRSRALLGRKKMDEELDEELQFHLEKQIGRYIESGVDPAEARRRARLALGGVEQVKEHCRESRGTSLIDTLVEDVNYGLRVLRKNATFTLVATATLAIGIGANTAIFSVLDAVLLHPLPYPQGDRLAMVWESVQVSRCHNSQNSPALGNVFDWENQNTVFTDPSTFFDWENRNTVFTAIAAIGYRSFSLTAGGEPIRIDGEAVSANLFSILQVGPVAGRVFTSEEDRPGADRVVLLGHALWSSRFAADPSIVGKTIELNDESYRVVGVMPAGFHFPDPDDQLWVPIAFTPKQLGDHGRHYLRILGRLKPGVTLTEAQSQMAALAARLTRQYPDSNTGVGVQLIPLHDQVVGNVRPALLVLMGAVFLVLLMVCGNITQLLLARASARSKEFAVRLALGATRTRLIRQLLTESILLGLTGGAIGVVIALGSARLLGLLSPPDLQRPGEIGLNIPVLAFTLAVSIGAGFLFGIVPAFQSSWCPGEGSLREGSREHSGALGLHTRNFLVVAETAIGVIVLVGAGLLLRSFVQLEKVPLGFDPQNVLSFRVTLPQKRYATLAQRVSFYQRLSERIESFPAVNSAGAISFLPLTLAGNTAGITIEGKAPPAPDQLPFVDFRSVTPGYFRGMAIPLLEGRDISWSDASDKTLVGVVSQTTARVLWPNEDPVGKRIKLGQRDSRNPWITVVGVVGDVHQFDLISNRPAIYFPAAQDNLTGESVRDWVVRTSADPAMVASSVRAAVSAIDGSLPVSRVRTMRDVISVSVFGRCLARHQFSLFLFGSFALIALVLAAVGLYGLISYSVAQRKHEIGIRMALGAQRRDILSLILSQGLKMTLFGIAAGLLVAFAGSRLMSTLLYGVTCQDPVTFLGVAILLFVVAAVGSYIPARSALKIDPMKTLRDE
jgi:predicted permease